MGTHCTVLGFTRTTCRPSPGSCCLVAPSAESPLASSGQRELAERGEEHLLSVRSEGAIIIGYPAPKDRGFYLAVWQLAKSSGPIVGGIINLALNANRDQAGSVG